MPETTQYISMSQKEIDRYDTFKRLLRGEINGSKAAELTGLSTRQVRRLKQKVKQSGAKGLIHSSRGKPSNRQIPDKEHERIVKLLHKHYHDFGPTFAAEKLEEDHDIKRSSKTIRAIMISEKLWKPKPKKKVSQHRSWRKPKNYYGEMEQFDGSYHDWFEGRLLDEQGQVIIEQCLLAAIDDATGKVTKAEFAPHEGLFPVFGFWRDYLLEHGKSRFIYLDKFSTYKMNSKAAKENHGLKTQFQRAAEELRIEPIFANSPQAKGRVERLFDTLQDRLIKEMRLRNICTTEEANRFLAEEFIPAFNAKFAKEPTKSGDLHRALTQKEKKQIDGIFSRQEVRTVQNDFTFSFKKQWYQLTKKQPATVCKKDKVIAEERLDGSVWIRLKGKYLNYEILTARQKKATKTVPWVLPKVSQVAAKAQRSSQKPVWKPAANHPWKKYSYSSKVKELVK